VRNFGKMSDSARTFAALAVASTIVCLFLMLFSISPLYYSGWVYAATSLPVVNCQNSPGCYGGTALFQVLVNPFYATQLLNAGSYHVEYITWRALTSSSMCDRNSTLYKEYSAPNKFCNEENVLVLPSSIFATQAMSVLAIITAFLTLFGACCCVFPGRSRTAICTWVSIATSMFIFNVATLGCWNAFPVAQNYYLGAATTAPTFNVTLYFNGMTASNAQYGYGMQQSYQVSSSDQLVALPSLASPRQSNGYNLWAASIAFACITQILVFFVALYGCRPEPQGSFGTGSFRQATPNNPDLSKPIAPTPVSVDGLKSD
jgi:hypothetical protein